jgi:F0F1-type ATP synthase membrane subunit b/b'
MVNAMSQLLYFLSYPVFLYAVLIFLVVVVYFYWIKQRRKKMLELRLKRLKEQREKANQNSEANQKE